jgi:hypothetical protein
MYFSLVMKLALYFPTAKGHASCHPAERNNGCVEVPIRRFRR